MCIIRFGKSVGEKVDESAELSTGVLAIVPALTTLPFALVRQEALNDCFDSHPHYAPPCRSIG